ncbi:MAG: aspartate-semialdehyde dehydrogenase [Oscillospiraceae bacterium]|nr:aspartate-semialdehyde dehydrogenase [Oscillospiraceae bacterium]
MKKYRAAVIGATGMVGQRFLMLLENHPWFQVTAVAASKSSAGKSYEESVAGRWKMSKPMPEAVAKLIVEDASNIERIAGAVDFAFCAVDLPKDQTLALEEAYARAETPVISCNSAGRMVPDIPMIIPELNPHHAAIIDRQRERLGTKSGFIAVKPNCSIQSYTPALHPLLEFRPEKVFACTYQAVSGAGKTLESWPEMADNVNPLIPGEEEKSALEPLKIWGVITERGIKPAIAPTFGVQCVRVPVTDGHMAAVSVSFAKKPSKEEILERWKTFEPLPQRWNLPSAPKPFLKYFDEPDRPQTRLDRDFENGMGVTIGRLRPDPIFDWRFVSLSHNTLRGAAGGAVLTAELLCREGYIINK